MTKFRIDTKLETISSFVNETDSSMGQPKHNFQNT